MDGREMDEMGILEYRSLGRKASRSSGKESRKMKKTVVAFPSFPTVTLDYDYGLSAV
jgi:hypothetical protein